jgi:hypothetical protein
VTVSSKSKSGSNAFRSDNFKLTVSLADGTQLLDPQ